MNTLLILQKIVCQKYSVTTLKLPCKHHGSKSLLTRMYTVCCAVYAILDFLVDCESNLFSLDQNSFLEKKIAFRKLASEKYDP